MDNAPINNNPEEQDDSFQSHPVQPVRRPRQKTTVEGIKPPRVASKEQVIKINLTSQEEDLISETGEPVKDEQKILPQTLIDRMEKKPTHYKAIFIFFFLALVLVGGGYEIYIKDVNKNILPLQISTPQQSLLATGTPQDSVGMSTSTPGMASGTLGSLQNASTTPGSASTTLSTTTPATPAAATLPQLTITSTPTGYLNVRSQPSTSASVVTQVHPGESYGYSQTQSGWYLITLQGGKTGWVSGQYVAVK